MSAPAISPVARNSTEVAGEGALVLFEDEQLLAVRKPAGMPTQPDRTGDPSLLEILSRDRGSPVFLVHRIDRPVSGVVLFAKTNEVLAACHQLFREREVEKIYWAIVTGTVSAAARWQHRIEADPRARKSRVVEGDAGKLAEVRVRSLAVGDRYTLVELVPEGGAFHQLRAQCAAAGHPIKSDVKYGARRGERDRSIALHARAIRFVHPLTSEVIDITADPPTTPPWPDLIARMR